MDKVDNILVIVDPTADEHPAVNKATLLAAKLDARVELFACETKDSRAMRYAAHIAKGGDIDFITHIRSLIESIAKPVRDAGVDVCVEIATGDPLHAQLLERTRRSCADLVIKDTHHHSIAKRTFITNTDWHLIRGCPVPLLLTKSKPWSQAPVITAAVDPTHVNDKPAVLDNRILDWSELLRAKMGGSLHAIHAFLPMVLLAEAASGVPAMVSPLTEDLIEEERRAQLAQLRSLVAPYGLDANCVHAELGVAADVVPRFAERIKADLIVMGAISRTGMHRLFIGSTAERVLENLPCDVLVVKPPDFATDLPF